MLERLFHPALEERRQRVPKHGKLEHDNVRFLKLCLFGCDVDFIVRIQFVKIVKLNRRDELRQLFHDGFVCDRIVQIRMTGDHKHIFHRIFLPFIPLCSL